MTPSLSLRKLGLLEGPTEGARGGMAKTEEFGRWKEEGGAST